MTLSWQYNLRRRRLYPCQKRKLQRLRVNEVSYSMVMKVVSDAKDGCTHVYA